jgi:hypothetical protein
VCLAILLFNNNTYAQATEIHTDRFAEVYTFTEDWKEVYFSTGFSIHNGNRPRMNALGGFLLKKKTLKKPPKIIFPNTKKIVHADTFFCGDYHTQNLFQFKKIIAFSNFINSV